MSAEILVAIFLGFLTGVVIAYVLLRRASESQAHGQFETWRAQETRGIRKNVLEDQRAYLKSRVADGLALDSQIFPFVPADTRFLGDPVHFVVFDGHTEIKDRSATQLRGVVFVTTGDFGDAQDTGLRLVEECVNRGKVRWLTVSISGRAKSGERRPN